MGNSCATLDNIAGNEYLKRLSSSEALTENDPFWNALLSFSLVDLDLVAMSSSNSKLLEDTISSLCKNLAINNVKTGNFHTLVTYFMRRLDEVVYHGIPEEEGMINPFTWQVLNALFIVRNICKYFIQNLSEEVIIQQFLKPGHGDAGVDKTISSFIGSLTKGLTELPIHQTTVLLHLEMVNTLITILGMVMYEPELATNNVFYIEIMEGAGAERAQSLTQFLLTAYSHHDRLPSYVYKEDDSSSLSSTLWSVMTLGMAGGSGSEVRRVNLGTQGALLLLILATHPNTGNPYARTLSTFLEDERQPLVKPEVRIVCWLSLQISRSFHWLTVSLVAIVTITS